MKPHEVLRKFKPLFSTPASSSAASRLAESLRDLQCEGRMAEGYPTPAEISHDELAKFLEHLRSLFNEADAINPHTGRCVAQDPVVRMPFITGHIRLYALRQCMGGIAQRDIGRSPYDIEEVLR
jgi:hypothetical protein